MVILEDLSLQRAFVLVTTFAMLVGAVSLLDY